MPEEPNGLPANINIPGGLLTLLDRSIIASFTKCRTPMDGDLNIVIKTPEHLEALGFLLDMLNIRREF